MDNIPEDNTLEKIWLLGQNPGANFKGEGGQKPENVILERLSQDETYERNIYSLLSYQLYINMLR